MEFYVKVKPDSDSFRIEKNDFPTVCLENPAENGRANSELLNRLEERLGERPALISGHCSSRKKLKIDISKNELESKIYED